MEKSVKFDELWIHLESLSDEEIDAVHRAAESNSRYKASLYGAYALLVAAIFSLGTIGQAIYRAYSPSPPLALTIILAIVLAIWVGAQLLIRINHKLFNQAVMREIRIRQSANIA